MTTITMKEVAAFLLGEASLDGYWFGERHPISPFWWREHLRAAQPATAPEPVAWMSPKRFYRTRAMALINGEQLIEPLYLYPPATAPEPSWHDAPTVPGLWVSDFSWMAQKLGRETVEFYAKNRSIPSRRWYGPMPEDKP